MVAIVLGVAVSVVGEGRHVIAPPPYSIVKWLF